MGLAGAWDPAEAAAALDRQTEDAAREFGLGFANSTLLRQGDATLAARFQDAFEPFSGACELAVPGASLDDVSRLLGREPMLVSGETGRMAAYDLGQPGALYSAVAFDAGAFPGFAAPTVITTPSVPLAPPG